MSQQDFMQIFGVQDGEKRVANDKPRRRSEPHMGEIDTEKSQWKTMYKYDNVGDAAKDKQKKPKSRSAPSTMLSSVFENSHSGSFSNSGSFEDLKTPPTNIISKAIHFFKHK